MKWGVGLMMVAVVIGLSVLAGCARAGDAGKNLDETGVLRGKVTVGPLSPVERAPRPGETPEPVPEEVYTSRAINVYRQDGKTLVQKVPFRGDGTYEIKLPAGVYVLDLPKGGIEHAQDLPRMITIQPGQVVTVDIMIDTGIR